MWILHEEVTTLDVAQLWTDGLTKTIFIGSVVSIIFSIKWGDGRIGISIYTSEQCHTVWDRKYCDKILCKFIWMCSFSPMTCISISSCSMPIATHLTSFPLLALILQCWWVMGQGLVTQSRNWIWQEVGHQSSSFSCNPVWLLCQALTITASECLA